MESSKYSYAIIGDTGHKSIVIGDFLGLCSSLMIAIEECFNSGYNTITETGTDEKTGCEFVRLTGSERQYKSVVILRSEVGKGIPFDGNFE